MLKFGVTFISFICGINAVSTFIDKGNRPELFELTDNEMPTFRITIPEKEFEEMKQSLNIGGLPSAVLSFKESLEQAHSIAGSLIDGLKRMNYTLLNIPEFSFNDNFPELKIGDDGMSQINKEEIIEGMHFEPEYYLSADRKELPLEQILRSNTDFDILKIVSSFFYFFDSPYLDPTVKQLIMANSVSPMGQTDFKTKNATLVVELNNNKKSFNEVTFSVGGESSRCYNKVGYNIKIDDKNNDLYGRTQLKLRPDALDPTYLRTKLVSDIHKKLGIKCISSNYAILYINDEYIGLFIMNDAYKKSWIKYEYGEKKTTSLYKGGNNLELHSEGRFENEDEKTTDLTEIKELLSAIDQAKSAADIEDIFEVDQFINEIAIEYLLGSWDNFNNGNNYYLYKQPNGKWIYLTYDFDNSFGMNMDTIFVGAILPDFPERMAQFNMDYPNYSIKEYFKLHHRPEPPHIIDILIMKDPTRFEKALSGIVEKVFNPATLYPHIDELKKFIKSSVKKEKVRNEKGIYPGGYNIDSEAVYSYEEWDANSEFTTVKTLYDNNAYGIKYWILAKYRNVCKTYKLECDSVYLDENYQYSVNKEVEFEGYGISETPLIINPNYNHTTTTTTTATATDLTTTVVEIPTTSVGESPTTTFKETPTSTSDIKCMSELIGYSCCPSSIKTVYGHDEYGDWGYNFAKKEWCGLTPYTTSTEVENPTITPTSDYQCMAELIGYPCCPPSVKTVFEHDNYGDWGYDYTKKIWCGLTPITTENENDDECWSEKLGYSCCKGCRVFETNEDGSWGFESGQWCGIRTNYKV